jgi:hypothetical protein
VRQKDYPVRFDEMVITSSDAVDPYGFQHAEPATMRSQVTASNPNPQAAAIGGITLGGSAARPILGLVFGTVPARTIFAQYAVDSTGKVDPRTIVVPPTTSANDRTSLTYTLPRIGYAPAHDAGVAICEMVRLQVELRPRGSG